MSTWRCGTARAPGLDAVRLSLEHLFPVCSPHLAAQLRQPADLLRVPLLHIDDRERWRQWLEAVGVTGRELSGGPVLNRDSMVIDAAVDGQGVALARTTLAATDLINGRLVRPFPDTIPIAKTYWIVCPKATAGLPKIATFRDWLLTEAARDAAALAKLQGQRKKTTRRASAG